MSSITQPTHTSNASTPAAAAAWATNLPTISNGLISFTGLCQRKTPSSALVGLAVSGPGYRLAIGQPSPVMTIMPAEL
jgi:hypothetical protein